MGVDERSLLQSYLDGFILNPLCLVYRSNSKKSVIVQVLIDLSVYYKYKMKNMKFYSYWFLSCQIFMLIIIVSHLGFLLMSHRWL